MKTLVPEQMFTNGYRQYTPTVGMVDKPSSKPLQNTRNVFGTSTRHTQYHIDTTESAAGARRTTSEEHETVPVIYERLNDNKTESPGPESNLTTSDTNITIVTAYFDLGTFQKGSVDSKFTTNTYRNWARTFTYLINPLVVYTDSGNFESLMRDIRRDSINNTKFIRISRNSSWAFKNNDLIARIFSDTAYPKHHPNTVVSEYACAQHAKFDVTARAARANYFHTNYFAWLDIGYFRGKEKDTTNFTLQLPPKFNSTLLSMNFIEDKSMEMTPAEIFKGNHVWVGGGLFLGTSDAVLKAEKQFMKAVSYFISQSLSSTDQQVVFAMFSDEGSRHVKHEVGLQIYRSKHSLDWFYLGYLMRKEAHI